MKRNLIFVSIFILCLTVSHSDAAFYEIYGRLCVNVDTPDNYRRNWSMVIKIGDITASKYLTCFSADKSTWNALFDSHNYSAMINLSSATGLDHVYIDNSYDLEGYKLGLVQLINHTHKIARYLQDLGHQVRIYYAPINTIDFLKRANDIPIGVRVSTTTVDVTRSNKLAANNLLINGDCSEAGTISDCVIQVVGSTCTNGYVSYSDTLNNPHVIRTVNGRPIVVSNEVDMHRWVGTFDKGLYEMQVSYPAVPEQLTTAFYFLWIDGDMKMIKTLDQNTNLPNTWHVIGYAEISERKNIAVYLAKQTPDQYYVVFDAIKFVKIR